MAVNVLREKHGLRMFQNSVLGKIFGPKRMEVSADWREMYNKGLHDL